MKLPVTVVWFRCDLRLADHPALTAAAQRGAVLPVYGWSPDEEGDWPAGAAGRWWLGHALTDLSKQLEARGGRLIVKRGCAVDVLRDLVRHSGATAVYWNRSYEPTAAARDAAAESALRHEGVQVQTFHGSWLWEPGEIRTKSGGPYQVFTPFWRTCQAQGEPEEPLPVPALQWPAFWPQGEDLDDLHLLPAIDWAQGLRAAWDVGEAAAQARLAHVLTRSVWDYQEHRDYPAGDGTSRLSPYLHWGQLSPRQVWHAAAGALARRRRGDETRAAGVWAFLRQLAWREFAQHLLHHFPHTPTRPLHAKYANFPWRSDAKALRAWQRGRTGFPLIDAGMRQLWHTGWMHNRVRMAVGSFLVKDLLLSWRHGAAWFWDTLVDADLANNTLGWQWIAGCGADAAPYFRVFNPVTQGEKFDPAGAYVRQWIPELAKLPDKWIHKPWQAPEAVRRAAGVELGKTYPHPIVDHGEARDRALAALATVTETGA
jgi:deoxyribodipyrimidine photo-lyase